MYQKYADNPKMFLSLTGYTREEFDAMLTHFTQNFYERMRNYCLDGKPRRSRRYSDYCNSPLPTAADKLFFILSYLKTNNLQSVQAAWFEMTQPQANRWIHTLLPVLQQTLTELHELPARELAELPLDDMEPTIYFHDGTERPIQRPRDPEQQNQYYSGKKKQHTVKNNVVIDMQCRVIFLTATVEGKKHDKKLADESGYQLPADSVLIQDTGFQGFVLENIAILQPNKKPRGKALTEMEKFVNQWLASLRVRVEHAIGGVKRYRIVQDRIRNWKQGIKDQVMAICCGLHNFRLRFRPWHYPPLQWHLFAQFKSV